MRLPRFINKTLSIRLSLMVVSAMAVLLFISFTIMINVSRKTIKEEALHKAMHTLEGTVQHIDNILLSVEQTSGNVYFNILPHIDDRNIVTDHCQKLMKSNPYIDGCAIAFKPYFYKDCEYFLSYIHHTKTGLAFTDSPIIQSETFGNRPYTEQVWFTKPMASGKAGWMNPMEESEMKGDALISFCIPIAGKDNEPVGVIGVDMSLNVLSKVINNAKPSPNSYCTLLTSDGEFIVHPDSSKLQHRLVFSKTQDGKDTSVKQAAQAMLSGETGYKKFKMNGTTYYVFYKPFKRHAVTGRSMEKLEWSVGIIYPEEDIFGDFDRLLFYVLNIAIIGLLLLFFLCRTIIHRQLRPLRLLTSSAQRIADGNYNEIIPDSKKQNEIGSLQNHFQQMQQSLATNMNELEELKNTLQKRGEELRVAYDEAQQASRMKTAFLHNMTNKMADPADTIFMVVEALCDSDNNKDIQTTNDFVNDIKERGNDIAKLLDNLLQVSDKETKKGGTA